MSVEIWVSGPVIELSLHGADPSTPIERLEGIIDTGASVICLDKRVAMRLGLTAINRKMMEVADGTQIDATIYMAEMTIDGLGFRDWVEVFALPMTRPSSRVLLGRSFLKRYYVTYSGPDERFHFHDATSRGLQPPDEWDG